MNNWDDLKYWQSGEWQVVQEKLDGLDLTGTLYNPARHLLFTALDVCPFEQTRVVIMGQDPYPVRGFATGMAFSIPRNSIWDWPPTLRIILKEYEDDLHLPPAQTGDLSKWASQGILLWNAIPSCLAGQSMSHDWTEWSYLTQEIVESLSNKGNITFAFLGAVARRYSKYVDLWHNTLIETGHPSPRGNLNSKNKFSGSRIFTTINASLVAYKSEPIDWNLEGIPVKSFKTWPKKSTELLKSSGRILDAQPIEQGRAKTSETSRHILEHTEETVPF